MLGAALSNVFKESVDVQLHSFPSPNIKSGSFVYDISLNSRNWIPNKEELRTVSAEMVKMAIKDLKFERLEVGHDLALEIFRECQFKREQLPSISKNGSVIVYRVGDHIDISRGPMMSKTSQLGRCTIGSCFKISDINKTDSFYRVQGVALPSEIILNHYAFGLLENRIKEMVRWLFGRRVTFFSTIMNVTNILMILFFELQNPAPLPNEKFEKSELWNLA